MRGSRWPVRAPGSSGSCGLCSKSTMCLRRSKRCAQLGGDPQVDTSLCRAAALIPVLLLTSRHTPSLGSSAALSPETLAVALPSSSMRHPHLCLCPGEKDRERAHLLLSTSLSVGGTPSSPWAAFPQVYRGTRKKQNRGFSPLLSISSTPFLFRRPQAGPLSVHSL